MRTARSLLALAPAVVAIAIAGCGGSGGSDSTAKSGSQATGATPKASATTVGTVGVGSTSAGRILVDSKGRSLYLFEKDHGMASTCYGACAAAWPPLTVSGVVKAGPGVSAAKLATTKRSDGRTEVTYSGHPLYYYAGDSGPGQITGEGLEQFGGSWDVLSPTGAKIEGGS